MNFQEEFSPNVKMTLTSMYEFLSNSVEKENLNIYTKHHESGVIEILINTETNNSTNFNTKMSSSFESYFNWYLKHKCIEPVSVTGISSNLELGLGSNRFSTMSKYLSEILTYIIRKSNVVPALNFDHGEFIKVAEYFRFMKYLSGGQHYPHYDTDYTFYDDRFVTKYSLIVYHNTCDSGELYFCNEPRNLLRTDWDRHATEEEIYLKVAPADLKIVLFPHNLCHGVSVFNGNQRNIIRGDLIFKSQEF